MMSESDQLGRLEAFEAIALPHLNDLFRTAVFRLGNRTMAEDVVQESYLRAWKSFHRFTPGTNCRAWLFKILLHNRDGIDRPKARRNEGGFTIGGPVIKDKFLYFGGYQFTRASTGFVPTASSITVLPEALGRINGPRTAANIVAAFRGLNPGFNLTEAQISPITLRLLNLPNPATGGFFIPAPSANAVRQSVTDTGNPLARQRNVFPAEFEQDQFTIKLDGQLTEKDRLSGTFFFSDFPGLDPFPDPSSLASPITLQRNDRNRTLAISYVRTFSPSFIYEGRLGLFYLNNSRRLDEPFLALTNESVGIPNPATFFVDGDVTRRLGHYFFRNNLSDFSFGGPNDVFNRRAQLTLSYTGNYTYVRGAHTLRFGSDFKRHRFDTNLPEEQATEFEFDNFTQFLQGLNRESDTQFGLTDKSFRFRDTSAYIADDWKLSRRLTLNLGLRWEWFGWPEERDGRIGNFDFANLNAENPVGGFIVPENVRNTGFAAVDGAIAASRRVDNRHTLNGQDFNNFAPRFGFAFSPFDSARLVIRGGYGIFFDRPSAAFINTIFSNYPFLREIEVTAPTGAVPLGTAFSQQNVNLPFNQYLPNRIQFLPNGTYVIRDGTPVTLQANGTPNAIDLATGLPARGNIAETFEFRAVDRDLRTPYVQQWNLGFQFELGGGMLVEARYVGTKGTKLLQAIAFNQGFDLNNSNTPDFIFRRFNESYNAAYLAEVRRTGAPVDFNVSNSSGAIIGFEARVPILGFNVPEALLLQSSANSIYNALQLSLARRLSRGLQFNTAYTFSKAIDTSSADPGSTAGSGRPDVPNVGFVVQGDQRNLAGNRAASDFDRTHRFSASFVYDLPLGAGSRLFKGWQISGFAQVQSGTPFSIVSSEPSASSVAQLGDLRIGSGGLFRLGFGRPNLNGTIEQLRQQGSDPTQRFFNRDVLASPLGGFGNLGRNVLRGPRQQRFDFGVSKTTAITERAGIEFRWDIFNIFNNVNFANPNSDLEDASDFGAITNTLGGPRVMQFGLKLKF